MCASIQGLLQQAHSQANLGPDLLLPNFNGSVKLEQMSVEVALAGNIEDFPALFRATTTMQASDYWSAPEHLVQREKEELWNRRSKKLKLVGKYVNARDCPWQTP